ncbi:EamA family transporter [Candidatus Nomurabacteria bacterium]|nr:EamA family transporter [Candidatus Nomurabacteria bacterium]
MNWQTFSIISCVLWGISSIFGSQAAKIQPGTATLFLYNGGMFVTALTITLLNWKGVHFVKSAIPMAILAGACSAIAVLFQILAFNKWPDKLALIVIIGSLYPVITVAFSLFIGQKFTATQWFAMMLALTAIVLVSLPQKAG